MNAQKQKGQALNAASAQKAMEILKVFVHLQLHSPISLHVVSFTLYTMFVYQANPDLIQAFQAAAAAGGTSNSVPPANKSSSSGVISGRGVDERAARAAAEVRKKAAARGLLIRPHGVPVQALPPLTQLLNIVNSGATPDASNSEASADTTNGLPDPSGDRLKPDEAPVGLGSGLASLDTKKSKTKTKGTS